MSFWRKLQALFLYSPRPYQPWGRTQPWTGQPAVESPTKLFDDRTFFRQTKETGEPPPFMLRNRIGEEDAEKRLTALSAATKSGLGAEAIKTMMESLRALRNNEEKRFQYLVLFADRPTSLQIALHRISREIIELEVMSDPKLVIFAK